METALSVSHPEGESKLLESTPINLDSYAGKLNIAWQVAYGDLVWFEN